MQINPMLMVAVPLFMGLIVLEAWWTARAKRQGVSQKGYELKDTFASLSMGIGYLVIAGFFKIVLIPMYYFAYELRVFEFETTVWTWVGIVLAQDFAFYWYHRYHHEIRIFWAAHVNHHSSEHYNLSTALRQSWTAPFTAWIFYIPLCFLGFDPVMLMTAELANLFYQFWIHTEVVDRIGPLEYIFNSASHHRVHHGSNEKYLDKNYGAILIIWDRMFGTFQAEEEAVNYGISKNIKTFNPVRIAFHEWFDMIKDVAQSDSVKDALGYVFREPGWQPRESVGDESPAQESSSLSARTL